MPFDELMWLTSRGMWRVVNGGRNPTLNGGVSQEFGMFSSLPC
jgi:hypothetical protein